MMREHAMEGGETRASGGMGSEADIQEIRAVGEKTEGKRATAAVTSPRSASGLLVIFLATHHRPRSRKEGRREGTEIQLR